jgi:hypothetical protein
MCDISSLNDGIVDEVLIEFWILRTRAVICASVWDHEKIIIHLLGLAPAGYLASSDNGA